MNKKITRIVYFTFWMSLVGLNDANAYIDPATTSYIVQIVAAFFITLGVVFGMFTTRAKLFLTKMKMKILAEHYARKNPSGKNLQTAKGKSEDTDEGQRPWKNRALTAFICSFAVMFTFVIFGIYDLAISNRTTLPFVFNDIWLLFFLVGLGGSVAFTLVISILRGKWFDTAISLLVGALLAGYIQGNFLNLPFGELAGDRIPWEYYKVEAARNSLIWIAMLLLPFIVKSYSKMIWKAVCTAIPILLVVVQLVSLMVSFVNTGVLMDKQDERYVATTGLYELSSRENILVILLDRLDQRYILEILDENPTYFNDLDGFTYYTDNITYAGKTYPTVIQLLTGENTLFDISQEEFADMAYAKLNFLKELKKNHYTTKLFMEKGYTYTNIKQIEGIADNVEVGELTIDTRRILGNFLELSAFRYAPHVLKPSFWTESGEFARAMAINETQHGWITDDHLFYTNLMERGLSLQKEKNNFSYIHLNGSHGPCTINAKAELLDWSYETPSVIEQTKGCFHIVREMIREMKRLGIYENANIIITGDHALAGSEWERLEDVMQTGLFVKRKGEAGMPLAVNHAPVNSDNFRGSMMKMAGLNDPSYPEAYWEVEEGSDRIRPYFYRVKVQGQDGIVEEFAIQGPGDRFENWEKITEHPYYNY